MEKEGLPLYLWRNDVRVSPSRKLLVFRFSENGKGEDKIRASYDDIVLRDGSDQNIELKPGDTIVVPSETRVLLP